MKKEEISSFEDLKEYVFQPKVGKVCHYTSYESLIMILKNRSLRLSRYDLLNDYAEKELSKCIEGDSRYIISFAHTKESVAMWAIYGKSSSLRLRLEFPITSLLNTVDNNFYFDSERNNKISIYGTSPVDADYSKKRYTYSSVVYYDRKKHAFRVEGSPVKTITVTDNMIQSLAGTIKYDAWEYEKETRLAVVLHQDNTDLLQKDVKYIYAGLNDEFIKNIKIRFSPWISEDVQNELSKSIKELAGFNLECKKSGLHGEISLI